MRVLGNEPIFYSDPQSVARQYVCIAAKKPEEGRIDTEIDAISPQLYRIYHRNAEW